MRSLVLRIDCLVGLTATSCTTVPARKDIEAFAGATTELANYRTKLLAGQRAAQDRRDKVSQYLDHAPFAPTAACGDGRSGCAMLDRTPPARATVATTAVGPASASPARSNAGPTGARSPLNEKPLPPSVCLTGTGVAMAKVTAYDVKARLEAGDVPDATADRPTEQDLFTVLTDYADALLAVSDAKDREALDAANAKVVASVTALASLVGTLAGGIGAPAVGTVAGAATALVLQVQAELKERERLDQLKVALRISCVPVRTLVRAAGRILDADRAWQLGLDGEVMLRATLATRQATGNVAAA